MNVYVCVCVRVCVCLSIKNQCVCVCVFVGIREIVDKHHVANFLNLLGSAPTQAEWGEAPQCREKVI